MKARVKATGEIVEVKAYNGHQCIIYEDRIGRTFNEKHLEFDLDNSPLDYWEKLKHQYAGMAMQSYVNNNVYLKEIARMCETPNEMRESIADLSILLATALVEKLKKSGSK